MNSRIYIIDACALIDASKNYPLSKKTFQSIWDKIAEMFEEGTLMSSAEIFDEVKDKDISDWLKSYKSSFVPIDESIQKTTKEILEKFPNMIICLDGELGSGKTVFTKGIANALGIKETITSPTFTIIKEYDGELPLYHMDVYRLDGNTEGVGIEEYFTKGGVVVIEWAETIKDILPDERLEIKFKIVDENKRVLVLTPYGKKYEDLCEAVL